VVIGIVCALRPEKGLRILMEAFRKVKSARTGVKLVIVGSGPMLAELQAGADADCHFEPAVGNVAPWLRAIDIFVLPSLSEALSNSLMEAMGCGCRRRVGHRRQSGTGPGWPDGAAVPSGDAEGWRRLGQLLDEPEYRLGWAPRRNAACTFISRGSSGASDGEIYQEFLSGLFIGIGNPFGPNDEPAGSGTNEAERITGDRVRSDLRPIQHRAVVRTRYRGHHAIEVFPDSVVSVTMSWRMFRNGRKRRGVRKSQHSRLSR
jgi:hypothetical protein